MVKKVAKVVCLNQEALQNNVSMAFLVGVAMGTVIRNFSDLHALVAFVACVWLPNSLISY